jgi:hypothetical protein
MREWMNKTQEFIDLAFSLPNSNGVKCPCSRCRNVVCEGKRTLSQSVKLHQWRKTRMIGGVKIGCWMG